jgi:type I restriction enzyme S subunit
VDEVDPVFLSFLLSADDSIHWFKLHAVGAVMPNLNEDIIKLFPLHLPPLDEQRAIAAILGALDDKIELNRRMNATLEEMARATFNAWFVHFEPVRAKAEGSTPQSADAATAALFPDALEEQQGREVPRGWEVGTYDSTIELIGGGTPKTTIAEYWGGHIPWFSVVDAPVESDVFVLETEKWITQLGLEESSARILPVGTSIVSARGTVGKCALVGTPMAMNQSCYGVRGKDGRGDYFTYFALRMLVDELRRMTHGVLLLQDGHVVSPYPEGGERG